jgi:biotin synthase
MFESLLEQARSEEMTPEVALAILQGARDPANAIQLFGLASEVRDQNLGRHLYWTAGISQVIPCRIVPRCRYCTYYARSPFSLDSLVKTAKKIEELGLRQLHLSGGSNLAGYDKEILDMVAAIRSVSDIEIEINLGASFSADTVRELKRLRALAISIPLETTNEELFRATKPGDSLPAKKELIELCEAEDIPIRTFLLIGLGETDADRIADLFYLKDFQQLSLVAFSRFQPYSDTQFADHPRCSPWEVAITIAVARPGRR